ncbi:hypothetical protein CDAR_306721 [Caerostris darwini]|uniref:Uncharacterized protein n=1 Tax=Caerostris darwini TaxID=1538125 RepID=A0AAV4SFP9_9ARAC|nr:hypothetical protein CDAR_306721 [Caerostris darwini]
MPHLKKNRTGEVLGCSNLSSVTCPPSLFRSEAQRSKTLQGPRQRVITQEPNPHDPISCSRCRRVNCTQGTIPKAQPSETEPSGCVRGGRLGSISRGKIGEPLAQVQTAVTPIWSGERESDHTQGQRDLQLVAYSIFAVVTSSV